MSVLPGVAGGYWPMLFGGKLEIVTTKREEEERKRKKKSPKMWNKYNGHNIEKLVLEV
jgi:hypothetical protein